MDEVRKIVGFIKHVDESVEQMLDTLDTTGYEDKNDLQLTMNGVTLTLGMNADTYGRLERFLIEEAKDMLMSNNYYERIESTADYQSAFTSVSATMIHFEYFKMTIFNPFWNSNNTEKVNPVEYYGKWFLLSDWLVEDRVKAMEDYINANS